MMGCHLSKRTTNRNSTKEVDQTKQRSSPNKYYQSDNGGQMQCLSPSKNRAQKVLAESSNKNMRVWPPKPNNSDEKMNDSRNAHRNSLNDESSESRKDRRHLENPLNNRLADDRAISLKRADGFETSQNEEKTITDNERLMLEEIERRIKQNRRVNKRLKVRAEPEDDTLYEVPNVMPQVDLISQLDVVTA